jgi:hypothetical protein
VKQLDLVALLADFHAQQVAHGEHADPALAIDNRKVTAADLLHPFEGLVGCFVTLNDRAQFAGNFTNSNRERITFRAHHALHDVALRKDANQPAAVVNNTDGTNVSLSHELSRFLHRRRGLCRVRRTVANHVPD